LAPEYIVFCAVDEIAPGTREVFDLDQGSILVFNVAGTFYAIENRCSHEEVELDRGQLDGCVLECPKHGATFDLASGEALTPPAYSPIKIYPVRIIDGQLQVGIR
jgi:3-phenylpropionate/trans-cinnamate dioxygenase ferredoxin subunit